MHPQIAICSHMTPSVREAALWALENGTTAVDYSFESDDLERVHDDLAALADVFGDAPFEVRYHCPFGDSEMAHRDPATAAQALAHFKRVVDEVHKAGGTYVTVHMGLNSDVHGDLDFGHAMGNLIELVAYARERNVVVCLENLRTGITSEPGPFMTLIEGSGAAVTFDVGHATSSPAAEHGFTAAEFAQLVAPHTVNAHIYDREGPGHIAPEDLSNIGDALAGLLRSDCGWWVVELTDHDEVRHTWSLLNDFLEAQQAQPYLVSSA